MYAPQRTAFKNSPVCLWRVFIVWISEQTAIISLYNINWLVFISETERVYCAVRTGYIYIYVSLIKVFKYVLSSKGRIQGCNNVHFSTKRIPSHKPSKWWAPKRTHRQQKIDSNASRIVFVHSW